MKYWMKQGVNRRNMEIVADEPESVEWKFACDQVLTLLDFPSSNIFFFLIIADPTWHFCYVEWNVGSV